MTIYNFHKEIQTTPTCTEEDKELEADHLVAVYLQLPEGFHQFLSLLDQSSEQGTRRAD